jgi:hypothetical protein
MLLRRGVFAGALFAGTLFGAQPTQPPTPPTVSAREYTWSNRESQQIIDDEEELLFIIALLAKEGVI